MKPIFTALYKASRLYWDTRFNDIHIPLSYDFAWQLLLTRPEADEDIVIPAILLHDNGWKMIPEERQADAFGPKMKDADLRRQHELEGVRIAREILSAMPYPPAQMEEILQIIDGHDSRSEALSLNDQLVKDADKLWRFTPAGLDIDHRRFDIALPEYVVWMGEQIEDWMFTAEAKEIARALQAKAHMLILTL